MSDKFIEMSGIVEEALGDGHFSILIDNSETKVKCTLSGKVRQNKIRILPGDHVMIHVSPYDLTHGRIAWRM